MIRNMHIPRNCRSIVHLRFFLISLLMICHSVYSEAQQCTFAQVTKNCALFEPSKAKLTMPDGTFIPNFTAITKMKNGDPQQRIDVSNKQQMKEVKLKLEAEKILARSPERKLSDESKTFFANSLDELGNILLEKKKQVEIIWPLSGKGEFKVKPLRQVKSALLSRLSQSQVKELKSIVKKVEQMGKERESDLASEGNQELKALFQEMKNITPRRKDQVEKIVGYVRAKIVEQVKAGRPDDQLSPEQTAQITKINAITMTSPEQAGKSSLCSGFMPQAFYNSFENSINICPTFYNYPDSTLVAVVGHEMGHSVDPCNSQFGLYSIDRDRLDQNLKSAVVKKDPTKLFALQYVKNLSASNQNLKQTAASFTELNERSLGFLENSGVLTKRTEGASPANYTFKDVYQCLNSPAGGNFRAQKPSEIEALADRVVSNRAKERGPNYDAIADKHAIMEAFLKNPECVPDRSASQMGEAFADWMGGQVLGEYLKDKKLESDLEKLAPFAFFSSLVCQGLAERKAKQSKVEESSIKEIADAAVDDFGNPFDPHPDSSQRLDDIFLRNTNVRAALGCSPDKAHRACFQHTAAGSSANPLTFGGVR
jgi:hypothetical protein